MLIIYTAFKYGNLSNALSIVQPKPAAFYISLHTRIFYFVLVTNTENYLAVMF